MLINSLPTLTLGILFFLEVKLILDYENLGSLHKK